ncbi:CDP-alcohol phosphatidyltransferase family protein [Gayadomonas joobiniege]|uniref:CDP-alcohol phosphatidyltransferase family protein n=1 Tax=Gayadomonas joobiniege TaxID=1234606 RepID=UPI00037DCEF1|nr:CDP-alcohol phosphatidyltransferase family protein [Gayadomonas joobiniege]
MLDAKLTPVVKSLLTPLVVLLNKCKISPDQLTFIGFLIGLLALPLLAMQHWMAALTVIIINRLFDGLDGQLARYQKVSSSAGGFLDISLDFLFYAAVPLGFAFADPGGNALPAAILLVSFIGTGSSFLAFAIAAEKYQIDRPQFKYKSFYYLQGLTEGTETILIFIVFCLWPEYFPILAISFALLCFITVVMRIYGGYNTLKQLKAKSS